MELSQPNVQKMERTKEENAIVLDFLPNGYPLDERPMYMKTPVAQAIGKDHFVLLELVPKKEIHLQLYEEVYIGEGKRDKIYYILGRLNREKVTESAKFQLQEFIKKQVSENEKKIIEFFNTTFFCGRGLYREKGGICIP